MAGLADLAQLLSTNTYEKPDFSESDPYQPIAGIGNTLTNTIMQNRNSFSPGQDIVGALITGLLSGGATGLSSNYQGGLKKDYTNEIVNELKGNTSNAGDLPPKLFQTAQDNVSLFNVTKELQAEQAAADAQKALLSQGVNLNVTDPNNPTAAGIPGYASAVGAVAASKDIAAAQAKAAYAKTTPVATKLIDQFADMQNAAAQINSARNLVQGFPGGTGMIGGDVDAFLASHPFGIGANSDPATYQRMLPNLAGAIQKANLASARSGAGGSTSGSIQSALSQSAGEGTDSLDTALGNNFGNITSDMAGLIQAMNAAGLPQDSIDKYTGILEGLKNGTIVDDSWKKSAAVASPPTTPTYQIRTTPNGQQYKVLLGQ